MGLQIARERRAHVHGCAQRAGHLTSQGTKPPLRAPDPLHAISHTMPKHVLCLAAATIWRDQLLGGPAKSEQRPCTCAVRSPTLRKSVPVPQETRNAPHHPQPAVEGSFF